MRPLEAFRFCPQCGRPNPARTGATLHCEGCSFLYHFNPAAAAGAFLVDPNDRVLFIRRAHEPARGKLAVPGGFIDIGETAEAGLRREILEEVNLRIDALEYLCSEVNHYHYRDLTYPVL